VTHIAYRTGLSFTDKRNIDNDKLFLEDGTPVGLEDLKDLDSFFHKYYPDAWIGRMAHDRNEHLN
jgi:hypothetical protein